MSIDKIGDVVTSKSLGFRKVFTLAKQNPKRQQSNKQTSKYNSNKIRKGSPIKVYLKKGFKRDH